MKKTGVLNQPISALLSSMGHTDSVVVSDAGLPIPQGPERIDLALRCGVPSFLETLETVLSELTVERAEVAEDTRAKSPEIHAALLEALGNIPIAYISHEELKSRSGSAKGIVRTGECTPFSNIILYSGVIF